MCNQAGQATCTWLVHVRGLESTESPATVGKQSNRVMMLELKLKQQLGGQLR